LFALAKENWGQEDQTGKSGIDKAFPHQEKKRGIRIKSKALPEGGWRTDYAFAETATLASCSIEIARPSPYCCIEVGKYKTIVGHA